MEFQSSRYRKVFISHSHPLVCNEDPEELHIRLRERDMFVAVVCRRHDIEPSHKRRFAKTRGLVILENLNLREHRMYEFVHHSECDMESLSDETWDVILSGTGLPQSLLAL